MPTSFINDPEHWQNRAEEVRNLADQMDAAVSRVPCSMVAWLTENDRPMARPTPNFVILDGSFPDVGRLVAAMLQARQAVESGVWSHPQEPTTEEWWADVLADPRARTPRRRISEQPVERTFYRLADEPREVILVACSKCDWKAAYRRAELIAGHGGECPMPSLRGRLAAPGCPKVGSQWDRCGVHYVQPVENRREGE